VWRNVDGSEVCQVRTSAYTASYREYCAPLTPRLTLPRRLWQAVHSCFTSQILSTVKVQGFQVTAMRLVTPCSLADTHRPAVTTCCFYSKEYYSSPNTVRVIKSRRMRWAGHYHVWGRGEEYTGFWWGNLRERDHLEDPGVNVKIIRGVSGKWKYITFRPIGKFLCLLWQHCRRPWFFTCEPCSSDSGRTGFVWVRRVWNGNTDPKSRQMRGAFRYTISQSERWTSSGNSQTNCCCLW